MAACVYFAAGTYTRKHFEHLHGRKKGESGRKRRTHFCQETRVDARGRVCEEVQTAFANPALKRVYFLFCKLVARFIVVRERVDFHFRGGKQRGGRKQGG